MFLEIATTLGAIVGAYLAGIASANLIAIIFGLVLVYSALQSFMSRKEENLITNENKLAVRLKLTGSYPENGDWKKYSMTRVPQGFGVCTVAV